MPHQHLVRAECVPVGASGRRVRDPLPGRGLYTTRSPSTPEAYECPQIEPLAPDSAGTRVPGVFGFGELFRELVKLGL